MDTDAIGSAAAVEALKMSAAQDKIVCTWSSIDKLLMS
jgi:hypothetical protein